MKFKPVVELVRLEESEQGTIGILKINKEAFCCTLEPQDKLNASNISSIPAQQYLVKRHQSPKYGGVFKVQNVPGRSDILIHPGNTSDDTLGCILLGQYFGKLLGARAVLNSGQTFREFMDKLHTVEEFHLTITEVY